MITKTILPIALTVSLGGAFASLPADPQTGREPTCTLTRGPGTRPSPSPFKQPTPVQAEPSFR